VVANIDKSRMRMRRTPHWRDISFAGIICKGPYRGPTVTRCGHYFMCAKKTACGSGINGVFRNLKKPLDKKKERAAREGKKLLKPAKGSVSRTMG
jgi:hypothetical protein